MGMNRWWQRLSVSKKLYAVVGVMALLILTELFTLYFAMTTLSAVRAFVGGEGLWSKGQKTGVTYLQKYANTYDIKFYKRFLEQLKIPLGDHKARTELNKENFNMNTVTIGFLEGEIHPQDIPPMVKLVRRFHEVPHFAQALKNWETADSLIFELIAKSQDLHDEIQKGRERDTDKIESSMRDIYKLDDKLTKVENDFSYSLGEASRWLENLLMILLLSAVILVEGTGLFLTISFAKKLTTVLKELNHAATLVGQGDYSKKIPIRSHDELGQLAESLNTMIENIKTQTSERQTAEHASETKNLFLANMSHEIRTPLNAILGFSEILADPNLSKDERARYAAIVKRTGSTLTSIIDDILDVSKVEADQLEIESKVISLPLLISDLSSFLKLRCNEKGIDLIFEKIGEVSDYIETDPVRLRQILANLIGNSIKFTDRGSVTVTYEAIPPYLVFNVKDTGLGIPRNQIAKLFKPFSQGDNSVRKKYGGTGLGLLISQRLAQMLGGNVTLKESTETGTTFKIYIVYTPMKNLPKGESIAVLKMPDSNANPIELKPNILEGKKILVVEDSLDNQALAKLHLTRSGAIVDFASNGLEGKDKALAQFYDVILMDIQMPMMDGYTATRELRKKGYTRPIIALTGYAMKEDKDKCVEAGCTDYIAKPFDKKSLIGCVARYSVNT